MIWTFFVAIAGVTGARTRGVWRGCSHASRNSTPRSQPRANEPFGPQVDTFSVQALLVEEESPEIEDVRYVGSYNWLDDKAPVILVPGSPPAWTPLAEDVKLDRDSVPVYRDINAARYPKCPMEPAVRSVLEMQSHSELPSVDVFGCGNTLGSLLRCARSQATPFRFDVVFMVRRGDSPTEKITDLQGYGQNFPAAYTTWDADVRGSCSHQRVISYTLGGMRFFVRSETDGYVRTSSQTLTLSTSTASSLEAPSVVSTEDVLGSMSVDTRQLQEGSLLEVRQQGIPIAQEHIFDIKTKSRWYKEYGMEGILPRFWVNQTPNFLLAYHQAGLFSEPEVAPILDDVKLWEKKNSSHLARYHALVKRIVDVVRDSDGQQFEISWEGQGPLLITKQIAAGRLALPTDLLTLWAAL
ncbi:uncharacterized protein LY89DRAFT_683266 [Mollisia scopiformis]|uniref:Geranylgeranyl pyrophosphate synthetase n=1 Tax=Mollisia scopiformis TaxID=149040 RepID=A0A194XGX8_MOLSC|nr:uncharacterized protein LY89DRAFT_683266 [Mollisia scopiformis]KUJ19423.1 hypothetical protein LY89DRAFT_683266 [Mollisia scopiformis]